MKIKNHCALLLITLALRSGNVPAQVFQFPTLESTMTDAVFQSLAASFAFRPLETASDLGAVWGASVGVSANVVDASALSNVFTGLASSYLPNADLQVVAGLPKGISLEFAWVPSFQYDAMSFSKFGVGAKWTLNRTVAKKFPVQLAARMLYTRATLGFTQPVTGGSVAVDYAASVVGGNFLASKYLGFAMLGLEPYVGVGLLSQSSNLAAAGTASLFGNSFPAGTAAVSGTGTSLWLQAGLYLKLAVLGVTAEYDRLFDMSSYAVKLSLRF